MAKTIDSFDFLLREISKSFASFEEKIAVVGLLYVSKITFLSTRKAFIAFRTHFVSKYSQVNLTWKFGKWAVVTGASQGIGKAYAMELAARNVNVILIDKDKVRLDATAQQIRDLFKVDVQIIHVNFNHGPTVYSQITEEIKGKEIGILVNNVGVMYDYPQYFLEVSNSKLWQFINVNIAATTILTHEILPQMVDRGRGAIVNVSAGTCSVPTPQITVYSATTAYLDFFSRALNHEYKDKGIIVQSLIPFYVATRLTRFLQTGDSKSGTIIPSADVYAKHAVNTLCYSTRTTGYFPHTIQLWLLNIIPETIWLWAANRLNNAFRRCAQHMRRNRHRSGQESTSMYDSFSESDSSNNLAGLS